MSTPDWAGVVVAGVVMAGASGLVCQAGHPLPPRLLAVWTTRLWQDDLRDGTGWCPQAQHLCSHAGEQAVRVWGAACLGVGWVGLGWVGLCMCAVHGHGSRQCGCGNCTRLSDEGLRRMLQSAPMRVCCLAVCCATSRALLTAPLRGCVAVSVRLCGCVCVWLHVAVCVFMTHGSPLCYWRM